jgi:peptide/nickel transport system ATP-binding protein
LISHDPDTLMAADRILVMYAGQIVESGSAQEVFSDPKHPYTRALMQCSTVAAGPNFVNRQHRLPFIPGRAPDPAEIFVGCSFASRCCDRMEVCDSRHPQLIGIPTGRAVRCLKYGDGV